MGQVGRPRIHDETVRDALVERAAQMVSEDGTDGLSVRKLARAVDTSTAAVYSLFGGKPGLIKALYSRVFTRFGAGQAAVEPSDDPLNDIVRLGLAYRRSAVADPHGYRVMFGDLLTPLEVGVNEADAAAETFNPLIDAVRRGVNSGVLPKKPQPPAIATALWANVHGLVSLELGRFMPPQAGDPATIFETAIRANLRGWASPDRGSSAQ